MIHRCKNGPQNIAARFNLLAHHVRLLLPSLRTVRSSFYVDRPSPKSLPSPFPLHTFTPRWLSKYALFIGFVSNSLYRVQVPRYADRPSAIHPPVFVKLLLPPRQSRGFFWINRFHCTSIFAMLTYSFHLARSSCSNFARS